MISKKSGSRISWRTFQLIGITKIIALKILRVILLVEEVAEGHNTQEEVWKD
jgi:hypothetical protein